MPIACSTNLVLPVSMGSSPRGSPSRWLQSLPFFKKGHASHEPWRPRLPWRSLSKLSPWPSFWYTQKTPSLSLPPAVPLGLCCSNHQGCRDFLIHLPTLLGSCPCQVHSKYPGLGASGNQGSIQRMAAPFRRVSVCSAGTNWLWKSRLPKHCSESQPKTDLVVSVLYAV